ncbi:MAG: hypothetical protein Q7J44_18335 [Pseudotabrizicola sp.]|uniref:hypothetical protein n=1 Tax=Pseudotabrizicola sp. TaxID=2939647 RepID=UPI002727F8A4|nr:hypothetical protein [Pseudotabrizicola sp.]MDO9640497.1 hypothetical protein [Pseudotabrizicola sp.]
MTQTTPSAQRLPLGQRILYGIPLIGRIAREVAQDVNNVFYLLVVVITLEILAFLTWGPVVFTLTALMLVPLMFLFFITISWPGRSRPKG